MNVIYGNNTEEIWGFERPDSGQINFIYIYIPN